MKVEINGVKIEITGTRNIGDMVNIDYVIRGMGERIYEHVQLNRVKFNGMNKEDLMSYLMNYISELNYQNSPNTRIIERIFRFNINDLKEKVVKVNEKVQVYIDIIQEIDGDPTSFEIEYIIKSRYSKPCYMSDTITKVQFYELKGKDNSIHNYIADRLGREFKVDISSKADDAREVSRLFELQPIVHEELKRCLINQNKILSCLKVIEKMTDEIKSLM